MSSMDTAVRSPLEIFTLPQHLVVPLFQRPYVWTEQMQWQPLWEDIRRLTEHRVANPSASTTHFLGAVVLQATPNLAGTLQPRLIIDGQQRLTTLQLLLDAAAAVFQTHDQLEALAGQLEGLTHNSAHFVQQPEDALKLRHTNRDRIAFDEVMEADPPVQYELLATAGSLIAGAHKYFAQQVGQWLDSDVATMVVKAVTLTAVMTRSLQLVVIDLRTDENSQEIFETLNARGTPLTASDLIKNFVFQRLTAEGVEAAKAYAEQWPFDTAFWEKQISVGRFLVTRSSVFLNQWLVARVGEEIGPTSTFNRFKYYVEHEAGQTMTQLLDLINGAAERYQSWIQRAADANGELSRIELSVYRTQAADIETVKPVLIWLTEPQSAYSSTTIDGVVELVESWLLRRALMRLSLSDTSRQVADLVRTRRSIPDAELIVSVKSFLTSLNSESTYWPTDDELRTSLATEQVFRRFKRGRLRMILEAAEDHLRGYTGKKPSLTGHRVPRGTYPIEHLLPQKWTENWPTESLAEEIARDAHVHRLGNLTLITSSLNSSISNGPWLGAKGKRAKLHAHDVILLNREVEDASEAGWTEELIDDRTAAIVDSLIKTWPVPPDHKGLTDLPSLSKESSSTTLKDLVAAGSIEAGSLLRARPGVWGNQQCEVLSDGQLLLDNQTFTSPSAAGHYLRKASTNGWWFWQMPDGRRLKDVRSEFESQKSSSNNVGPADA